MKTLSVTLGLAMALMFNQASLANDNSAAVDQLSQIETVFVVAESTSTNFEIFGVDQAREAIQEAMDMMLDSIADSIQNHGSQLVESLAVSL